MSEFKVYYEDTDASGRVYHANYLKFFERGRTDLIYQTKYTHDILLYKFNIIFVVKECSVYFIKPALFEDTNKVNTKNDELTRVKIKFNLKNYRGNDLLAEAQILVLPVSKSGKISKLPNEIYLFLESLLF